MLIDDSAHLLAFIAQFFERRAGSVSRALDGYAKLREYDIEPTLRSS